MATVGGFACGLLAILYLSSSALVSAIALPVATPVPAVPVQVSSVTSDGAFRIMRDDLVFQPPDSFLYVFKQQWRQSTTTLASLQICNPYMDICSYSADNPGVFLTREGIKKSAVDSPAQTFDTSAADNLFFNVKCCGCGNGIAPVTFYWPQGGLPSSYTFLTTSDDSDSADSNLSLSLGMTTTALLCGSSNLKIQLFPNVIISTDGPHPTSSATRRRRSTGQIEVQMIADFGTTKYVVGVKRLSAFRYVLSVLPYAQAACFKTTTFFYNAYEEHHIGLDGNVTSRPSFTLQHVATGLYVVADVLGTFALNVESNFTGLDLKSDSAFDPETPDFPDYRFFVRYDDLAYNLVDYPSTPGSSKYLGSLVHILCPLYHRRFCIVPTTSGNVKVAPVTLSDQRPWPTLVDPLNFSEFLGRLNGNGTIPTFDFIPIGSAG